MKSFLLTVSFLSLFLSPTVSFGAETCSDQWLNGLLHQTEKLEKSYQKMDARFEGISEINRPTFKKGRKKSAIMLVHGYMGSPSEMSLIAKALTDAGYPVYNALIPGFGATPEVANNYENTTWKRWFHQQVQSLKVCYNKIHLIGFSTGGLLIYDYLSKNPQDDRIGSASLISPFFETHSVFLSLLQGWTTLFLDTISINTVYYGLGFPDVEVMIKEPESYLQEVPIRAGSEIAALGKEARDRKINNGKIVAPVLMFISPDDLVIRQSTAEKLVMRNFENWVIQTLKASPRSPHHLMAPAVSPVAKKVQNQIVDFITNL